MKYNARLFADQPLYGLPVAVIDFETTGVDPHLSRAVEMAIVHLNLGQNNPEVVFKERFNPGIPIPEGASNVHGISDEDVVSLSGFNYHISRIEQLLKDRVIAAYNLPFDWVVLNSEYRRSTMWHPDMQQRSGYGHQFFGMCGLVMARYLDTDQRGRGYHKLSSVCERRGISLEDAHSADADSLATAKLLELLLREATQQVGRFPTVRDFWGWQRIQGIEQERGLRDWLRSKGKENHTWPWTDY
jgi:DNA polymerase-3 subunit epsilon